MPEQDSYPHQAVSFDNDLLILVNEQDQEVGFQDKLSCHQGQGILHRAFSVFIFNDHGELLLQKRSAKKHLWPLYWSNSCCSHPRQGEAIEQAAQRRTEEELGISCELNYLYKFCYQAQFNDESAEHELCSVFVGYVDGNVAFVNANEVAEWRYVKLAQLDNELKQNPERFTPWFKLEWRQLKHHYRQQLQDYCKISKNEEW